MEIVILGDLQSGYASDWARIANSSGLAQIQIGDRFREQGFGPGSEELEVAGIDISRVGGLSRLFFNRAAHATQPMTHRLGAVLELVATTKEIIPAEIQYLADGPNTTSAVAITNSLSNGSASADAQVAPASVKTSPEVATEPLLVPLKRGRGRPPGSRNKTTAVAKPSEAEFPTGF